MLETLRYKWHLTRIVGKPKDRGESQHGQYSKRTRLKALYERLRLIYVNDLPHFALHNKWWRSTEGHGRGRGRGHERGRARAHGAGEVKQQKLLKQKEN